MSAIAFVIDLAIAALATLLWALSTGDWTPRPLAGMFLFGLAILLLPMVIHA